MANVVVTAGKRIAFFDAKKAYEFVTAYVVEHHILPAVTVDRIALTQSAILRMAHRSYLVTTKAGTFALTSTEYQTLVQRVAEGAKNRPLSVARVGSETQTLLREWTHYFEMDVATELNSPPDALDMARQTEADAEEYLLDTEILGTEVQVVEAHRRLAVAQNAAYEEQLRMEERLREVTDAGVHHHDNPDAVIQAADDVAFVDTEEAASKALDLAIRTAEKTLERGLREAQAMGDVQEADWAACDAYAAYEEDIAAARAVHGAS